MLSNLLFIDTETTGTDAEYNDIIQIATIQDNKTKSLNLRPINMSHLDFEALRINNISLDALNSYEDPNSQIAQFVKPLKYDNILAGWNVYFDYAFLKQTFKKLKRKDFDLYFSYRLLDIHSVVMLHTGESMSLKHAAEHFETNTKPSHEAMSDIKATYEIYQKLLLDFGQKTQ